LPVAAQVEPAPHDDEPQHTPSVQNRPFSQLAVSEHALPRPVGATHVPDLHASPATQSAFVVQVVLHALVPQTNEPQVLAVSPQAPAPLQVLACVSTPSAQLVLLQAMVPVAG
jgi:hypothetical protein